MIERFFQVPLDYSDPTAEKIVVFARHIIPISKAKTKEEEAKLPFCVYSILLPHIRAYSTTTVLFLKGKLNVYACNTCYNLIHRRPGIRSSAAEELRMCSGSKHVHEDLNTNDSNTVR